MLAATFNQSCTNLDEELYGEVTPENFFNTEEEILAALGAAYTQFGGWASGDPCNMQLCFNRRNGRTHPWIGLGRWW